MNSGPFKPYAQYSGTIDGGLLDHLHLARAERCIRDPGTVAAVVNSDSGPTGMVMATRLTWDSERLGRIAAGVQYLIATGGYEDQLCTKRILLGSVLRTCSEERIAHLTARVNTADLTGLHALEESGFLTVDGILTFSIDLRGSIRQTDLVTTRVRLAGGEDVPQIREIARTAYSHDRFHSDPSIDAKTADGIYEAWAENSCLGTAADAVLVAEENGRIASYVTCKVDRDAEQYLGLGIGTIVLVASAPWARGHGLAKSTTAAALGWFQEMGIAIVEVGTQLANIGASRLYESCGFRLVGSSLTLRKLVGNG